MKLFSTHSIRWHYFPLVLVLLTSYLTLAVEAQAGVPQANNPIKVKGTVTDAAKTTLPSVTIQVKGTSKGTTTDFDGNFELEAIKGDVLIFSFVGFLTKEVTVLNDSPIKLLMESDAKTLDEIVVVGYGTEKKSLVTGTISKVESDEITKGVVLSPGESLQGRAAGVIVQAASGQPGDGLSVNIRGVSTTGNSQPLYVVDGMPVSDVSFLNPSDIESMEVLKDAASASIYGSRGGNGVVLITTKKGTKGSMKITYDGYYGIQNPWRKPDVLNAKEYAVIANEARLNDGAAPLFSQEEISSMDDGTDWWDEVVYPNAPITNHTISLMGGNETSTFSSSLSYFSQDGTFAEGKSNYERITARLNTTHKFGILKFGNNFSYSGSKANGVSPNSGLDRGSIIAAVMNYDPTAPIRYKEGENKGKYFFSGRSSNEFNNPVAMLDIINNQTIVNRLLGNLYADVEIIEGLNFRSSVSLDWNNVDQKQFNPQYFFTANLKNDSPSMYENRSRTIQWQVENTLNFSKKLGDHSFSVLLGQSALEQKIDFTDGAANKMMFNDFSNAYLTATFDRAGTVAQGGVNEYRLASLFGRFNYNYKEKYMLSGVVRSDVSTRFAKGKKTGYYPSISVGWVASREDFFPENDVLTFAKLRASWGQNGNDRVGDFGYTVLLDPYTYSLGRTSEVVTGLSPRSIANPELTWETIEQTNIGVDLHFFDAMFTLSSEYYIKTTKDILIRPDAPAHAGNYPPAINGGDVQNRGIEVEANYKAKTELGLNYSLGVTYAYNTNEMTSIKNRNRSIIGADAGLSLINATMAIEGHPIGAFYGYETDGIFQNQEEINRYVNADGTMLQPTAEPGDLRFVDSNKDGKIDDNDRDIIGNPIPTHTIGLNASVDYKGLDFSIFVYSALGHDIFNSIHRYDMNDMNWQTTVLDRWTGEGSTNEHPRVTMNDPNRNRSRVSDYFVEDADMIRIRKMSLGYTLPESITSTLKLSKLRVYASVENLATFTKYSGMDPEIGSAGSRRATPGGRNPNLDPKVTMNRGIDNGVYPSAQTFIFGLNLAF